MSKERGIAISLLAGSFLAALTLLVAFGLAAFGHGWNAPLLISTLGVFAFPIGIGISVLPQMYGPKPCMVMACVGILTDVAAGAMTFAEGTAYFAESLPYGLIWIVLWLSWQIPFFFRVHDDNRMAY